jgi:hypothetical protein
MHDEDVALEILPKFKDSQEIDYNELKKEFIKLTGKSYYQAFHDFVFYLEAFDIITKNKKRLILNWKNFERLKK